MIKNWLLALGATAVSLLLALGVIRLYAPQLLGAPVDLQLVQVDEKVPPFFEGVFRREDYNSKEFLIKDPYTRLRARPLLPAIRRFGPHDILGFRNHHIPNVADIIVIGDSQTYGNNALLNMNFPSQLSKKLEHKQAETYAMAVGAWGAIQYYDMFSNATVFRPRVIVVAFYTGNDPIESFQMAYGVDRWNQFITDDTLSMSDVPKVTFPAPQSEWWPVKFRDGITTVFTPTLRLTSNQDHPAIEAGYAVMAKVARAISKESKPYNILPVFTIVPTKELVYAKKVSNEGLVPPDDYVELVIAETKNIDNLAREIGTISNAKFVDVVEPLQNAALSRQHLYGHTTDGHPMAQGYSVIASAVAAQIENDLPEPYTGLIAVRLAQGELMFMFVNEDGSWHVPSPELLIEHGWDLDDIEVMSARDIAGLPINGTLSAQDLAEMLPSPED